MRIFFGPEYPEGEYFSIALLIHRLGYTATLSPDDDFDLAMLWEDATHVDPPPLFAEIAREKPVLNLRCTDISKRRVEEVFRQVFGYGSFVDPREFEGRCIEKSDENAVGGGSVVRCPVAPREGFVYQKLIDSVDDGVQVEYRTPVILGEIPVVNVWHQRPFQDSLDGRVWLRTVPAEPSEVYTAAERERLLELCARMGFDFGEVDVLRSRDDGKLYVLDANKTPAGYGIRNRTRWRHEDKERALSTLADCLDRQLRALLAAWRPAEWRPEAGAER